MKNSQPVLSPHNHSCCMSSTFGQSICQHSLLDQRGQTGAPCPAAGCQWAARGGEVHLSLSAVAQPALESSSQYKDSTGVASTTRDKAENSSMVLGQDHSITAFQVQSVNPVLLPVGSSSCLKQAFHNLTLSCWAPTCIVCL